MNTEASNGFCALESFGKFGSKNEFSCTGLNSVCSENTNLT